MQVFKLPQWCSWVLYFLGSRGMCTTSLGNWH